MPPSICHVKCWPIVMCCKNFVCSGASLRTEIQTDEQTDKITRDIQCIYYMSLAFLLQVQTILNNISKRLNLIERELYTKVITSSTSSARDVCVDTYCLCYSERLSHIIAHKHNYVLENVHNRSGYSKASRDILLLQLQCYRKISCPIRATYIGLIECSMCSVWANKIIY